MLPIEERGKLITSIFDYSEGNDNTDSLSSSSLMAFEFIKDQLDRDAAKYQDKCDKNRANGKLGGRPKKQSDEEKTERFCEKPNGLIENRSKPKKADNDIEDGTDNDIGDGTENDTESDTLPPQPQSDTWKAARAFNAIWEAYPPHRRGNRDEALKTFGAIYSSEIDFLKALEIFKSSEEWKKENGRFVPGFVKWIENRSWESILESQELEDRIFAASLARVKGWDS